MKKIMFKDKYGLTDAVLKGRKTMTRRVCKEFRTGGIIYAKDVESIGVYSDENLVEFVMKDGSVKVSVPRYKVGEVVAVAQSYKALGYTKKWVEQHISPNPNAKPTDPFEKKYPGWNNKMFTHSELERVHKIEITNIKVERLQDISDEDCLKEGIYIDEKSPHCYYPFYTFKNSFIQRTPLGWDNPREAFAALIDKIGGKGTWERNPWVFAYSFKLVK